MTPLVFVDTETTSLHPGLRRPWEIGMIRRNPDGSERRITILIPDVDLSNADPTSLQVGRFDERAAYGRKRPEGLPADTCVMAEERAAEVVYDWTTGAHLVGAVPDFDAVTLDRMLRRHGRFPRWHYHLIDVETLAVGWLNGIAAHGHSSVACSDSPIDCAVARGEERQLLTLPWKSDDLSRACGVEPPTAENRHTAMGDADWAKRWFDRITGGTE